MLIGNSRTTIDAKMRTSIPSEMRDDMEDSVVLALNFSVNKCIRIFPLSYYSALTEKVCALRDAGEDTSGLEEDLVDCAKKIELDAQGRFVLPTELRSKAGITKDIIIIGKLKYVEVWDLERYKDVHSYHNQQETERLARTIGIGV